MKIRRAVVSCFPWPRHRSAIHPVSAPARRSETPGWWRMVRTLASAALTWGSMVALSEEVMPFLVAAVRADGAAVLAGAPDAEADTAAGVGRRLLWEVFGRRWMRWPPRCMTIPICKPRSLRR
jgi:hypothetical protein